MSSKSPYGYPETRARILDAAWELVAQRGSGVTLGEVATRAGVSRQALYLHFGDRTGLILGLVRHMDETLEFGAALAHVAEAPSGDEVIRRAVELAHDFNGTVDPVARVLEAAQHEDEALATAWRDRMDFRRASFRPMIERIAEHGELADTWTVETAADLFYAVTSFGPWRELTREVGWSRERYVEQMTALLGRALLAVDGPDPAAGR